MDSPLGQSSQVMKRVVSRLVTHRHRHRFQSSQMPGLTDNGLGVRRDVSAQQTVVARVEHDHLVANT